MSTHLILAAVLALYAAFRLLLWRWHVRRDVAWLARKFGPSESNEAIAQAHSMTWTAGCCFGALLALYV
jgi:hypothetical protein